jgi:hypothetical protein
MEQKSMNSTITMIILVLLVFMFLIGCSTTVNQNPEVFGTFEEASEYGIGKGELLATENVNGTDFYLYLNKEGTESEDVAVATISKVDEGYIWNSSPSFRLDTWVTFDFNPQNGGKNINVLIGKVNNKNVREVKIEGYSGYNKVLNVYKGYFWDLNVPIENSYVIDEELGGNNDDK